MNKLIKIANIIENALLKMQDLSDWLKGIPTQPVWIPIAEKGIKEFKYAFSVTLHNQLVSYQEGIEGYSPVIKGDEPVEVYVTSYEEFIKQYILKDSEEWINSLSGLYKSMMFDVIHDVAKELNTSFGTSISFNKFDETTLRYLEQRSIKWATQIQGTTEEQVKKALLEGYKAGKSFARIAQDISSLTAFDTARAEMVARTEILQSSNYADYQYNVSTGIYYAKRWRTSMDERVRQSHQQAEGQVVLIHETFTVGGFALLFPGDSSNGAPAKEIINCRCGVEYLTEEEYKGV